MGYQWNEDSNRTLPNPLNVPRTERSMSLTDIVIQNRDDDPLRAAMVAGFKTLGIKL
ncbi:hypothetical protein EI77_03808 [Prosthecobacter fusiformis]|uniref:Uncharacterized protein n=1 Tax=Prosthecobacter fusiformis TaxID=48464 RepID=A0A4R7RL57_9BACT|nr:hypothetical protein EI77_03808 [Prosthecobacter fusiformis]